VGVLSNWRATFKPRLHAPKSTHKRPVVRTGGARQAADRIFDEAATVDTEAADCKHELSDYAAAELESAREARSQD
jgi:hypothetical protein